MARLFVTSGGEVRAKFESRFKSLVSCTNKLKQPAEKLGYKRTPGVGASVAYRAR